MVRWRLSRGGAGGIGSAICRRFAEEGAKVAVFDINKDAADKVGDRDPVQ